MRLPAAVDRKVPSYSYQRGPIREETSEDNPSVEDSYRPIKKAMVTGKKTTDNRH